MKKVFKVLGIVLVVLLAVVGTAVIFFKNLKKEEKSSLSLVEYLYKAEELNLSKVNYDGRFDEIMETNENLQDCLFTLSAYLINEDISVSDEEIVSKLNEVESSVVLAKAMVAEYEIKINSEFYDRNLGRNDLYRTMCDYVVDYAQMIILINDQLSGNPINKSADVKFDMIDLYCRVAINTYGDIQVEEASKLVNLKNANNIQLINDYFCMETSFLTRKPIDPNNPTYPMLNTSNSNKFTQYYNLSNRDEVAKNLALNVNEVSTITEESTSAQVATYYFKQIYGIQ